MSRSNTRTLIGSLLAGSIGMLALLVLTVSCDSGKLGVVSKAEACTQSADQICLPDVSYVDTTGKVYTPKDLAGKVVVINFWATWCKPCLKEIPDFSRAFERYKDKGVVVLGILTSDDPDDSTLLNFQSDNDMSYPVVRANSDILVSYMYPDGLPTTFVFDRGGKQVFHHKGPLKESALAAVLEPLVQQQL
jgi:thiol-disulfide isomerase/thioredoxin